MEKELTINTRESEYADLTVRVDGELYKVKYPITTETLAETDKYEKEARAGNIDALANQIKTLTDIPFEKARKLDVRIAEKILVWVSGHILGKQTPKDEDEVTEKNGERPDAKDSQ